MASEAITVLLALIGIGVITVGVMLLMQRSSIRETKREEIVDGSWVSKAITPTEDPRSWQWRGHSYSHLPVRPILIG